MDALTTPPTAVRVVFAGTASFAVPSLVSLFEAGYTIPGVVSQPDRPGGRGQALQAPPVKQKAVELRLPVYQPASLKNDDARALFTAFEPDVLVVVAYGKILPSWLIDLPRFGVVNVHGSLLPRYRGAAPIQWAVANGETETGVCTMKIDEGLDTGPVYLCERTQVPPDEDVRSLSERLSLSGARLLARTLHGLVHGELSPAPQDAASASYAPILKKTDGYLDWKMSARELHNRIRAFNPWPGAVTGFRDGVCKILRTAVGPQAPEMSEPGTIIMSRRSVAAAAGDGNLLEILEAQPPNRKAMSGSDFANGMRLAMGEKFHSLSDN